MSLARFLPRFRESRRQLARLEARESWSRAEIETLQLERLNDVWAHAIEDVPHYVSMARQTNLPRRFATLQEFFDLVPVLQKSVVRSNKSQFMSRRPLPGLWKYTSGTTGQPISVYWSREAHREALSAKYRLHAAWGVDLFDRIVWLWGPGVSQKPGLKAAWSRFRQPYLDRLRNRLRLSAFTLDKPHLRQYLGQIREFRPAMLYAYSRALYLLAREADGSGFHCDSLKVIVASSEPAWPHIIQTTERALGAPVAREYGSQECGMIAMDDPAKAMRVREDQVLVETLPRPDGQYDIIVTPLNNPSFPLLRYAIGDVTDMPLRKPERGMAILSSVAGRSSDLLRTPGGEYLHWVQLENAVGATADKFVRRFTMDQRADGSVEVEVELDDPSRIDDAAPHVAALRQRLTERLQGYPVTVRIVDEVCQTSAGKHRVIRSELYDMVGSTQA